ncbi:MAG: hypothetical protein ACK47B_12310 [Armatimonadota bacterium]
MQVKRTLGISTLLLLPLLPAVAQEPAPPPPADTPAAAPAEPAGTIPAVPTIAYLNRGAIDRVNQLELKLRRLEEGRAELQQKREELLAKFTANAPEVSRVEKWLSERDEELAKARAELAEAREEADPLRIYRPLLERVDVQFKNATVREAIKALSEASRARLAVAEGAPSDRRLSVDARGVTLGAVLEAVARQGDLMIYPAEGGALLRARPMLIVDGKSAAFSESLGVWSGEWGLPGGSLPGAAGGFTFPATPNPVGLLHSVRVTTRPGTPGATVTVEAEGMETPIAGSPTAPAPAPGFSGRLGAPEKPFAPSTANPFGGFPLTDPAGSSGYPGMPYQNPYADIVVRRLGAPSNVSVTSLGDGMIVVAEPGPGPDGATGAWLTVYRWQGGKLVPLSSTYHRSKVLELNQVPLPRAAPRFVPVPGAPGGRPRGLPAPTAPAPTPREETRPTAPDMRALPPAPATPPRQKPDRSEER